PTTDISPPPLTDALPIWHRGKPGGVGHELQLPAPQHGRQNHEGRRQCRARVRPVAPESNLRRGAGKHECYGCKSRRRMAGGEPKDRKSTRLNSSHEWISY